MQLAIRNEASGTRSPRSTSSPSTSGRRRSRTTASGRSARQTVAAMAIVVADLQFGALDLGFRGANVLRPSELLASGIVGTSSRELRSLYERIDRIVVTGSS
jgi:hypothetical protein